MLRDALGEVRGDFDLVLLDCPPQVYLDAWAALVAADGVVVPLQGEDYGAQGHRVRSLKKLTIYRLDGRSLEGGPCTV